MRYTYWGDRMTDKKPRERFDFYPTGVHHVRAAFDLLPNDFVPEWVLDPGMGLGVFGKEARNRFTNAQIVGAELNLAMPFYNWYDWNLRGDFLRMEANPHFDLVIGNPPYVLARQFIKHSMGCLRQNGYLIFLLRESFAGSQSRYSLFTKEMQPQRIVTISDRPSFTRNGKTDGAEYAYFVWQKGYEGKTWHDWVIADPAKQQKQVTQLRLAM